MADIFISHSEEDSSIVIKIAKFLEEKSFTTWYYKRDYVAGTKHLETTGKEIERCQAFIVLISKASLVSDFVFPELLRAIEKNVKLVPILIDLTFNALENERPRWSQALGFTSAINWDHSNTEYTLKKLAQGIEKFFPGRSYLSAFTLGASLYGVIGLSNVETLEEVKKLHDLNNWIQETIINTLNQSAKKLGMVLQLPIPGEIIKDPNLEYQKLLKDILPYLNDVKLRNPLVESAFMMGLCGVLLSSKDLSKATVINDPNIKLTINNLRQSVSKFNMLISEDEIIKKVSITKNLIEYLRSILPD